MPEKSLRFARNIGFSALGQTVLGAINFCAVPYLVGKLGVETYGLYIILHAAASYLNLAYFGAGAAVVKHVASGQGARDGRILRDTLRYAGWTYGLGALLGGAALWVGARFVATHVFHIPAQLIDIAIFVLRCVAVGGVFVALSQGSGALMQGLQRFDYYNLATVLQNGFMPLGALALVAVGFGLRAMAGWYAVLNGLVGVAACVLAWRLLKAAWPDDQGEGLRLKTFILWSLTSWLGALAWIVAYQADKIFIARHLSLSALTLYSVPAGLLQRLQVIPATVATVAIPMLSEIQGPQAQDGLRRMHFKSTRFVLWVCLPILVALFALMPQFLSLWLGGRFSEASCWPARLLVLAQACLLLNAVPNAVSFSREHPWYTPAWAWSQAFLSLLAWRLLIPRYALLGVALGSLLAVALPTVVNLWLVNRRVVGVSLRCFAGEVLAAPFLSAALMLAVLLPVHAMATDWGRLLALTAVGATVFYGTSWLLLNDDDRNLLKLYLKWERWV